MGLNVSNINSTLPVSNLNQVSADNKIAFRGTRDYDEDSFELSENKSRLSLSQKQSIAKSARKNAAGWSILGGILSTLYYATRSNNTIAKKYNLDPEKDKQFIKQIKNDQTLWTLPGALGLGIIGWIVAACIDKENIDVE